MAKTEEDDISPQQESKKPSVSVIIPTYKRGHLLKHVLEALTKQTSGDFEVLIVLKPSGDGTEEVVRAYGDKLRTELVIQTQGFVVDALNLGLERAEGEIILFLDDDAIPLPNLVHLYIISYTKQEIGGVAGDVIPITLRDGKVCPFEGTPSEIVPVNQAFPTSFSKIGSLPLKGQEDYMVYLSKAGFVSLNYAVANRALTQTTYSLLAKGANMSISSKAAAGFRFPTSWIFGLTFEQYLGWYIWRKGYRVLFNPNIKAYHIHHGQSLSRNVKNTKKEAVLYTESRLLFFRLYNIEPELSLMHRLVLLLVETTIDIKSICLHKETFRVDRLRNKFYAELIGLRWLIYKRAGSNYSPLEDLKKILR